MKEFGGYLPFELKKGSEWYTGENVVALNCARYAIVYAAMDAGYKKLYIPFYMCDTVKEALERYDIDYAEYHFEESFYPKDVALRENEGILYPNYYGLCSDEKCKWVVDTYRNVIFDNTQAFFAEPKLDAYYVYSCRKFIGVSDGAYVVHKNISHKPLEKDISNDRMQYLFKCLEEGTNAAYADSLNLEKTLTDSKMMEMSDLTHLLLKNADYETNRLIRRQNYSELHKMLGDLNYYHPILQAEHVPMVYPFYYENEELRDRLVQKHHIYIPQWWKVLLERENITGFEENMIRYLLPLPIDMRYGQQQMSEMASLLIREMG